MYPRSWCVRLQNPCHAVLQVPVTLQLLQAAFSSIPNLLHLLLISQSELQQESHAGLSAYFSKSMHGNGSGLWLYECSRQAVLPTLQVRALLSSYGLSSSNSMS